METLKREQLADKLLIIQNKLSVIRNEDKIFIYNTRDKHVPGVGYINEVNDIEELLKFQRKINEMCDNDYSKEIGQLGLEDSEIPKVETKILGFNLKHWTGDIQTKLAEIRLKKHVNDLISTEATLMKHLNEDDLFKMDISTIDESIFNDSEN